MINSSNIIMNFGITNELRLHFYKPSTVQPLLSRCLAHNSDLSVSQNTI